MAILRHQQIRVRTGPDGRPRGFHWPTGDRGAGTRERQIAAIHRTWRVRWNWWAEETHRLYYRVETVEGGVYELYQEQAAGRAGCWYLERVWD